MAGVILTLNHGATAIEYELRFAARKTLGINVYPDQRVIVKAPLGSEIGEIEAIIRKRAGWIVKQQRTFASYPPAARGDGAPRRYLSGESYRYLGRQYRLKVLEGGPAEVRLGRNYLFVSGEDTSPARVKRLLDAWYRAEAIALFERRLAACFPRVAHLGVAYPTLSVRAMKARWGSCGTTGKIILNLKLIRMPVEAIDYVIIHELCHLKEHNHSKRYYALLDRALPDWRERRRQLNMHELD